MKKALSLLLALSLVFALAACSGGTQSGSAGSPDPALDSESTPETAPAPETEPVELIVFAAASMTETMNQIAEMYKEVAPNVTLVYNFDSSGTLKTQIE